MDKKILTLFINFVNFQLGIPNYAYPSVSTFLNIFYLFLKSPGNGIPYRVHRFGMAYSLSFN